MRPHLLLLSAVLALSVLAAPALAEDEVDPGKALLKQLMTLRKAEDAAGLAKAAATVPEVYKASADKSLRGKLLGELGKVVKDDDLGAARLAAVDAIVAVEDPKAAWKTLARNLPGPKVEEASEVDLAVVRAAGTLAQSRALKPLLELAAKAKQAEVAAAAAKALGGFNGDKRGRVKLLDELISIGKRTRPGRSTEKAVSEEAQKRWETVRPSLVAGLNKLTGRDEGSFEDWEALWDEYKKRPKQLFVD